MSVTIKPQPCAVPLSETYWALSSPLPLDVVQSETSGCQSPRRVLPCYPPPLCAESQLLSPTYPDPPTTADVTLRLGQSELSGWRRWSIACDYRDWLVSPTRKIDSVGGIVRAHTRSKTLGFSLVSWTSSRSHLEPNPLWDECKRNTLPKRACRSKLDRCAF